MTSSSDNLKLRKELVSSSKRIVVKVGSRLLTGIEDVTKQQRIQQLVAELNKLRKRGLDVILVSSGAIAAGMKLTETERRPTDVAQLQALAAVGQSRLMSLYESACQEHGFHCAQILLSLDDLQYHERHLNVRNCIDTLLGNGILPIINENDTVSVDEICFGDNDRLAAMVGTMTRSDITILLTTIDGLCERENGILTDRRISTIHDISDEIRGMATGTDGNEFSVGGMATKLDAAEIVMSAGETMWIANGTDFSILQQLIAGDNIGTVFAPSSAQLSGAKRFLAFFAAPTGNVVVDAGAARALRERGKSLLASGIVSIDGQFDKGDTVQIVDESGEQVAVGVSNYSSTNLELIKGRRSDDIAEMLLHKRDFYQAVVHRNNMAIV